MIQPGWRNHIRYIEDGSDAAAINDIDQVRLRGCSEVKEKLLLYPLVIERVVFNGHIDTYAGNASAK